MALLQKIPLSAGVADQKLGIELDGNPYRLRVVWNERFGYFSLTVMTSDDEDILTNIKMVKNYPLTARFKDTRLPTGSLYFVQEKGTSDKADFDGLGVTFGLYYYEPDTVVTTTAVVAASEAVLGTIWDSGLTEFDEGATSWDN
jgi:hypothetical protein